MIGSPEAIEVAKQVKSFFLKLGFDVTDYGEVVVVKKGQLKFFVIVKEAHNLIS